MGETDGLFIEGKSLCSSGNLWFVRHSARWPSAVLGEEAQNLNMFHSLGQTIKQKKIRE